MVRAYGARTVGQCTPRRYPGAGKLRAALPEQDDDHAVLGVLLATHRRLATLEIETRSLRAGFMRAVLVTDVDHAFLGMSFAVNRPFAAPDIEGRHLRARDMCATFVVDVDHAGLGMHLTVRRLAALDIEGRHRCARFVRATGALDVNHTIHGMPFAENRPLASLDVKGRPPSACAMRAPRIPPLVSNVDHVILGMHLTIRCLVTLNIEIRPRLAGGVQTALLVDVGHAVPGMLLAVHCRLVAIDIVGRCGRARTM